MARSEVRGQRSAHLSIQVSVRSAHHSSKVSNAEAWSTRTVAQLYRTSTDSQGIWGETKGAMYVKDLKMIRQHGFKEKAPIIII